MSIELRNVRGACDVLRVLPVVACLLFLAGTSSAQVKINEIQTFTPDAIELRNLGGEFVDLSGWELRTFTGFPAAPVPDPVFVFPTGTGISANGLLVVEENDAPPSGPPANTVFTGFNYPFTGTRSVEVVLLDDEGRARDYVFRRQGVVGFATPNRPSETSFDGFLSTAGNTIARIHSHDTDHADDWHVIDAADATLGQPNAIQLGDGSPHHRLMITEVSNAGVAVIELTNFTANAIDLTGWRLRWTDSSQNDSLPLDTVIQSGEIIVVREGTTFVAPPGVQNLVRFGSLTTPSEDPVVVTLLDPNGIVADEVNITGSNVGPAPSQFFSNRFEGLATRFGISPIAVERVWGVDSDTGEDWTSTTRSLGLENFATSGRGGVAQNPVPDVRISEIDSGIRELIELHNADTSSTNLENWFFLISSGQGQEFEAVYPFPTSFELPAGGFVVIGDSSTVPAELPAGVTYLDLSDNLHDDQSIALSLTNEYSVALYTAKGEIVDMVRVARAGSPLAHNDPRAPSGPFDFRGQAFRISTADGLVARIDSSVDTNQGRDWQATLTRTMGFANAGFSGPVGSSTPLDVRLNDHALGGGLSMIICAGSANRLRNYQIFFTGGHANGNGPFFGLGPDGLLIAQSIFGVAPFAGTLDNLGNARPFDVPPGSFTSGIDSDNLVLLFDPVTFEILGQTQILEFDT